jgi:hypothetical protein
MVAPLTALAIAMAYGGGIDGAQRLRWVEKLGCELAGWAMGALIGSYVAARLRKGLRPQLAVLLGLAQYAANGIYFIPGRMPTSFWLLGAAACVLASIMGAELGSAWRSDRRAAKERGADRS